MFLASTVLLTYLLALCSVIAATPITSTSLSTEAIPTNSILTECGFLYGHKITTMTNSNGCTNIGKDDDIWFMVENFHCGICMLFEKHDCKGEVTWTDGAKRGAVRVKDSRSYFCS